MSRTAQIASLHDRAELARQLAQAFADFQQAMLGADPEATVETRLAGLHAAPETIAPPATQQPQRFAQAPNSGQKVPTEPQKAVQRSIPRKRGGYERD